LDGLRIDTYPYCDKKFLSDWSKAVTTEYPKLNIVGEEWSTRHAVTAYWQKGQKNKDGYQSYLPALMDFPLNIALIEGLKENDSDWGKGMLKVYQCLSDDYLYVDANNLVTFCDNHDMNRNARICKKHLQLAKNLHGRSYRETDAFCPRKRNLFVFQI
jgi:hypothetical protein